MTVLTQVGVKATAECFVIRAQGAYHRRILTKDNRAAYLRLAAASDAALLQKANPAANFLR